MPADDVIGPVDGRNPLPEGIEHDGLVLRRWTPDDADLMNMIVTANRDHLIGYMPWIGDEPIGVAGRRAILEEWDRSWRQGGDVAYAVFDDGLVAGACGLHRRLAHGGIEIGYWVDIDHLGRGIARRSAEALTNLAFSLPEFEFVEIHHDISNVHSRRVPEQLGYTHVGRRILDRKLAPLETGYEVEWRVTRAEWEARGA